MLTNWEQIFRQLSDTIASSLTPKEAFRLELVGEASQFIRFNQAKVRQIGTVVDGSLKLTLMEDDRSRYHTLPFTGAWEQDWPQVHQALQNLRHTLPQSLNDPHLVFPVGKATSRVVHSGQLPKPEDAVAVILPAVKDVDFVGLYAGGRVLRGQADSAGQFHWFETDSFVVDYSCFTDEQNQTPSTQTEPTAVKGCYAGSHWDQSAFELDVARSKTQLQQLNHPLKSLPKGQYRTYLAPAAVADLASMLSWNGISEAAFQQGESALALLRESNVTLSPHFTLQENFTHGLVPQFNDLGEVAPDQLLLIEQGQLRNTLISSRTAKEYGLASNGAGPEEGLRSPEILPGTLSEADILQALDTGLYVSNLHYLNWSDQATGRITGMTRYACFWVEKGKLIAPIERLRFDESLYHCFGKNLLALTQTQTLIPEVSTYGYRELGCSLVPGMLVENFTYTL